MLSIAYISTSPPSERPKRLTAKEKLHAEAIVCIAAYRIKAKARAQKLFSREWEMLKKLENELNINHKQIRK